MVYVGA